MIGKVRSPTFVRSPSAIVNFFSVTIRFFARNDCAASSAFAGSAAITLIAGRMRRHAALRSRIIECEDGVGRAAGFERADLLKILALKKQVRATRLIQP